MRILPQRRPSNQRQSSPRLHGLTTRRKSDGSNNQRDQRDQRTLNLILLIIFCYAVVSFVTLSPHATAPLPPPPQEEQQVDVPPRHSSLDTDELSNNNEQGEVLKNVVYVAKPDRTDTSNADPAAAVADRTNDGAAALVVNDKQASSTSPSVLQLLKEPLPKSAKIHKLIGKNSTTTTTTGSVSSLEKCQHTMVTGYFHMRSKYTGEKYLEWMANFLSVQDCMVIFTSSDMVETIAKLRSSKNVALQSRTVLIEMSIDDLPIARLGNEFWQHQLDIDREKRIHRSFQLFWIWLSKSWCVVQAIRHNFFQQSSSSEGGGMFMWQDIGSYRNSKYNRKTILVHTEIVPDAHTILWLAHHPPNPPPDPIWNDKFRQKQHYFHSGSQGVGQATAWLEYHDKFAQTIQQFLQRDMFIGEDQCVLQSTCQQFPHLCAYLRSTDVNDNFYFGLRYALVNGGKFTPWRMPQRVPDK